MFYSANPDKKESFKAVVTPHTMQELKGQEIVITNLVITEKTDENGEIINVTSVKVDDTYYSSISKSMFDSARVIAEMFDPDEILNGFTVLVDSGKSKNNREFLFLNI